MPISGADPDMDKFSFNDVGVLEVWEFLCQFSEALGINDIPAIESLAHDLGVATSCASAPPQEAGVSTNDTVMNLIDALTREAFDAAVDIAAEASPDVKPRDVAAAFPSIKVVAQCGVKLLAVHYCCGRKSLL